MSLRPILFAAALAALATTAAAQATLPSAPPADAGAAAARATGPALSPEAGALLDQLQSRAGQIKTFQGDLKYDRNQLLQGDRQRRRGTLVYEPGPPSRFAVHFNELIVDHRSEPQNRSYVFDGQWLVEKIEDQKQFFKQQVVGPNTPPDKADPLNSGDGPFPLPITMDKARILARYFVELLPAKDGDPANTLHLHMTPRQPRSRFNEVDIWEDKTTLVPLRVRTMDDSENESIIEISNTRLNEKVDAKTFDTAAPTEPGWRVEVRPWEEK